MSSKGGRVHVLSDMKSCYIFDVEIIPNSLLSILHHRGYVEVIAESTSLSGFVVKITLKPCILKKVMTSIIIMSGLCAINYYILTHNVYKMIG